MGGRQNGNNCVRPGLRRVTFRRASAFMRLLRLLYDQVLLAIAAEIVLGTVAPDVAVAFKPLGDGFVRLIKMITPLLNFVTVVVGIAKMGDMKELGRVGLKAPSISKWSPRWPCSSA